MYAWAPVCVQLLCWISRLWWEQSKWSPTWLYQSALPRLESAFQVWHMCTDSHLENTHTVHTEYYMLYLLGEWLRELHEVALTLVVIIHSERMSHSETRKPFNFPQRGRKEERAKWVKGGWSRQMEREKKEWQNVCQMRKGGKMKGIIRVPAVLRWLLKGLFVSAAPPFSFNPTPPRLQTTHTDTGLVSSLATASSFPHGQSFSI